MRNSSRGDYYESSCLAHCNECHDRYQLGNRSSKKLFYNCLTLGIKRYDELFEIATFYARNGFLTVPHVNKLMFYLEEDYPDAKWNISRIQDPLSIDVEIKDSTTTTTTTTTTTSNIIANDTPAVIISRNDREVEVKPSSNIDEDLFVTFEARDEPILRNIVVENNYDADDEEEESSLIERRFGSFYRYECLLRGRKISSCRSYVTCLALFSKLRQLDKRYLIRDHCFYTNLFADDRDVIRYDVTKESDDETALGNIKWYFRDVKYPFKFPNSRLLVTYHDRFDLPFYLATFYENYRYLTIQHLEFIFNNTVASKKTSRLHIIRTLSKIRFDVNCSDAIRNVSSLEKYLEDFIIRGDGEIYHFLLNNNILRIWEFINVEKFVHYYLNFFDENLRLTNKKRLRTDFEIRAYVFSRVITYRLTRSQTLHDREISKIKSFFFTWLDDDLYQMAFPCSFYVSRKDVWTAMNNLINRGIESREIFYLECIASLRNLPSINIPSLNLKNPSVYQRQIFENLTVHARTKHRHKEISLDDPFPLNRRLTSRSMEYTMTSKTFLDLKAFYEIDETYRLKDIVVLDYWDTIDTRWIELDTKLAPPYNVYDFTSKTIIDRYLDDDDDDVNLTENSSTSSTNDVIFYINERKVHFSGNFKSLHLTNWQEYGFDNPTPFFKSHLQYVQNSFFSDISKLMKFCFFR